MHSIMTPDGVMISLWHMGDRESIDRLQATSTRRHMTTLVYVEGTTSAAGGRGTSTK